MLLPGWAPLGDRAFRAPLPAGVEPAAALAALRAFPGVRDAVVTDAWMAIYSDGPLADLPSLAPGLAAPAGREHVIEVRYDGADLDEVAARSGLPREQLIAAHAGRVYRVLFLGFLPGFGYLGALDARIVAPRRPSPRPRVPAGAVAVAGGYTGIYPSQSPGGWNLIGSAVGFVAWSGGHATLAAGDRVRFVRAP